MDAVNDLAGKVRSSSRAPWWPGDHASGLPAFGEEPLELVDGDQSRPPGHLECLDQREHPPVERRGTDTQCLGSLASGVGKPFDAGRLEHDRRLGDRGPRERRVALRLLRSAPWPAA